MNIRFVIELPEDEREEEDELYRYKLLSLVKVENDASFVETLVFMARNKIPIMINIEDMADVDGDKYYISDIRMSIPPLGGETNAYIEVYLEEPFYKLCNN